MPEEVQPTATPVAPSPSKFNTKKVLLIVVVIALVAGLLGGLIYWYYGLNQSTSSSNNSYSSNKTSTKSATTATSSATKIDTSDWKIYNNDELKFSLSYPSDWITKPKPREKFLSGDYSDEGIVLTGEEGSIEIAWATEYGGGCPDGYEKIQVKTQSLNTCHGISNENENWNQITWASGSPKFQVVYADAKANTPYKSNRSIILKILSTLEVPTTKLQ